MSAVLSFDAVSTRTTNHELLFSGLTLSIGADCVGLLGRNRVGKSTLLRIVSGALPECRGRPARSAS